jgi:mRNA-degrading endonuclease YafQ of YafQ-DinJ toxin-antitoxin module
MKQGKIIDAYKALNKLASCQLPIKTAYQIHKLRAALKSAWDFQCEEEGKLIERLHPVADADGNLTFATMEGKKEFLRVQHELSEQEQEIDYQPVTVGFSDGITLSANDIDALDGFVTFGEGNDVHN